MSEERKRILNMVAEGKITAEEAEQLLDAMGNESAQTTEAIPVMKRAPKYLHVTVDAFNCRGKSDADTINVRVPIQLLRAGMRFAALIPKSAQGCVSQALHDKGIQFNLADMTPKVVDELITSLEEVSIDVGDGLGSRVRVFCEG